MAVVMAVVMAGSMVAAVPLSVRQAFRKPRLRRLSQGLPLPWRCVFARQQTCLVAAPWTAFPSCVGLWIVHQTKWISTDFLWKALEW